MVALEEENQRLKDALKAIRELANKWRQLQLKDKFECVIDGEQAANELEALLPVSQNAQRQE